jgi:hypothetical protein
VPLVPAPGHRHRTPDTIPAMLTRRKSPRDLADRAVHFLEDLPKVHERGSQPAHSGGLNVRLGKVMIEELQKLDSPSIVETGAGCSTLLFLMLGCPEVTAIAPDPKLGARIQREAKERDLPTAGLRFIDDRSERALPRLALDEQVRCQAGFIDGNHGWPSVFVDFCYLNMMMDEGALLFVDDVHIYACTQLMLLLTAQPDYELVRLDGKMATFRKATSADFLPDWRGEPFIEMNTSGISLG